MIIFLLIKFSFLSDDLKPHGEEALDSSCDTKRNNSCTDQSIAEAIFKRPSLETGSRLIILKLLNCIFNNNNDVLISFSYQQSQAKDDTTTIVLALITVKKSEDNKNLSCSPLLKAKAHGSNQPKRCITLWP